MGEWTLAPRFCAVSSLFSSARLAERKGVNDHKYINKNTAHRNCSYLSAGEVHTSLHPGQ